MLTAQALSFPYLQFFFFIRHLIIAETNQLGMFLFFFYAAPLSLGCIHRSGPFRVCRLSVFDTTTTTHTQDLNYKYIHLLKTKLNSFGFNCPHFEEEITDILFFRFFVIFLGRTLTISHLKTKIQVEIPFFDCDHHKIILFL